MTDPPPTSQEPVSQRDVPLAKVQHAPSSSIEENYSVRAELLHEVEAAGHRRDRLEEVRQRFIRGSVKPLGESLVPLKTSKLATGHDVREELTSALVQLLTLEKDHTDQSPEIISVRKQITRLQTKMAFPSAITPEVRKTPIAPLLPDNKAELERIDQQIILSDREITSYLQQLSLLDGSSRVAEDPPRPMGPGIDAAVITHTPSAPNLPSGNEAGGAIAAASATGPPSPTVIDAAISGALGLVIALAAVLLGGRSKNPIVRDEATLRGILPSTVVYGGRIPRMKAS